MVDLIDGYNENLNLLIGNTIDIFSEEFVDKVRENIEIGTEYGDLIRRFIHKEPLSLEDISSNLNEELLDFNNSLEVFFFTPIIFYIIRETIKSEISIKK